MPRTKAKRASSRHPPCTPGVWATWRDISSTIFSKPALSCAPHRSAGVRETEPSYEETGIYSSPTPTSQAGSLSLGTRPNPSLTNKVPSVSSLHGLGFGLGRFLIGTSFLLPLSPPKHASLPFPAGMERLEQLLGMCRHRSENKLGP